MMNRKADISLVGTPVRISACIAMGDSQRHFEVSATTFEEAYADLVKRMRLAGYVIERSIPIAGTTR